MSKYEIAVIGGDGVGPEVIEEGIKTLEALGAPAFRFTRFDWSSERYKRTGRFIPEGGLDRLAAFDAIFFGAVGDEEVQDHITLNNLILPIRRRFDQYACVRPAYLYAGVQSPLAGQGAGDIDMVVIRENTEGEYADIGGRVYQQTDHEVAVQTSVFTRHGTERIIRYAFEEARRRDGRRLVTSITKSNAQGHGMVFWDEVFDCVKTEYGDVETESLLIDAAAMDFVRRPQDFDVVVASNLFGDILTDISAITVGSMGLAPSANLNPERIHPSMFEPVHGSAFELIGKSQVNPIATILAAAMMVEFLDEEKAGAAIRRAVSENLAEGRIRTPDIGGESSTVEVGDDIVRRLSK
ncbi:MAG: tartrate dehydrogenase [Gemmatimonadetes bacterium]|nr:tartrate dehydrogenase [Gemmatimonadota bacterium]MYH18589.1 tartrate dehydrogenase [Gemmatimonadota bacterium]MYK98616.1 tartrate dehydrogenase [Gemmatimonadota bacterium]